MSFLNPLQTQELAAFASIADREARSDLSKGYIRDENDYTSNFVGALRRIINSNSRNGLSANSFMLSTADERRIGADAGIILTKGAESKVAVLEAKWPRFSEPDYAWDYEQKSSGISHFSTQIQRQKRFKDSFAIFGMFYVEYPFGKQSPFLYDNLSSCVWHEDLENFRASRDPIDAVWTQEDLEEVIAKHPVTIGQVMTAFAKCLKGKPIKLANPNVIAAEFRLPNRVLAIQASPDEDIKK